METLATTPSAPSCPRCHQTITRQPTVATYGPIEVIIEQICDACGHSWASVVRSSSLRPAADPSDAGAPPAQSSV